MATVRTLLEVTFWLDWWFYAAKSLAMHDISERAKVQFPFVACARSQLLVAKTASTIWANLVLMCHSTVLEKVKDNISSESFIELCNASLSGLTTGKLFPHGALEREQQRGRSRCSMMR